MGSYENTDWELQEKCAVVGLASDNDVVLPAIEALRALQHRGQEASGIACQDSKGILSIHREPGLVRDVYHEEDVAKVKGNTAVGHNRYSTHGDKYSHMQPVVDESIGFALSHNGNLAVLDPLEEKLRQHNVIPSRLNDSEMMARAIATYIRDGQDLPSAVRSTYGSLIGAFSCTAIHDNTLVAFRDPKGIRPLAFGEYGRNGWIVASETCALDAVGANYIREIKPGEMATLRQGRPPEFEQLAEGEEKLDLFEFIYFARPDSLLYGQRVNEVRRRFGHELAITHGQIASGDKSNTLVVPVPDTSIPASEGFAEALNLQNRQAIIKDRYIGRTFILPDQAGREQQLKIKHSVIPEAVNGKDVIVIDDSIVRLNTIPKIVSRMRKAGAKTVSVLIASPPVRFTDHYGMDTPSQAELAAANMTIEEMRQKVGCEYLGFLSLGQTIRATNISGNRFNLSSFTGDYPAPIGNWMNKLRAPVSMEYVEEEYINHDSQWRSND